MVKTLWMMNKRRNPLFTGREALLVQIDEALQYTSVALSGLGGIGKTQIAIEYSYRYSEQYQAILWLDASSRETLSKGLRSFAYELALEEEDKKDEDRLFATAKHWLQNQSAWLLILDHIDDAAIIDLIIPSQGDGQILLTTTRFLFETYTMLPVPMFMPPESILFLLRRARIIPMIPMPASLEQAPPDTISHAEAIVQKIGGFPLALDQVGAYLEETGGGLNTYLELFSRHRAKLLERRGHAVSDHTDAATLTIARAIEEATQKVERNVFLLRLLAFLHPNAIPYEMLRRGAGEIDEPIQSLVADRLSFNQAIADLRTASLVHHLAGTMMSIHRIVQAVVIDTLSSEQQNYWAGQAVSMVNSVFPEVIFDNWAECARYLPQAQQCATLITAFKLTLKAGALLLQRLGSYYYRQARYSEAETYLKQALSLHEEQQWADTQEIARILNSLGLLYYRQARYSEAEQTHQRALALREQTVGPDHLDTAESLHNLALLYRQQGKYQQAEQLYQRELAIEGKAANEDHPERMAQLLNNFGLLYYEQGKYTQAEAAYLQALFIYDLSSPGHPDRRYSLDGLGALTEKQGKYQQAEALYQRAWAICEQTFGDTHPETAHSLNKLADIYETQDKDQQAKALYQRALSIGEQALGPEHPDVALFLNNLAYLADKQGDYQQAEQYYQRALSIGEQALGPEHPLVADVLNNLGEFKTRQKEEHAEALLRRALAIREQTLGQAHEGTAQSLSNLAILLVGQGENEQAERLFQRAYAIRLEVFGPTHLDTAYTRDKYAALLESINKNEEATVLRQAAQITEEETTAEQGD